MPGCQGVGSPRPGEAVLGAASPCVCLAPQSQEQASCTSPAAPRGSARCWQGVIKAIYHPAAAGPSIPAAQL